MDNSFEKLINRVLDGRYKIESVVGIGGMAYVLKATDLQNENRPVAIKVLNEEFNKDENAVKRFVNESEAVAMVDSPNIVKIFDVAISDNLKYIVMEFIDGITLKDYMDKIGALGWKEAVHYVRQILVGLTHAHEKEIVHRDIKPQNVMLLRDGLVKVTDFGIAKTPTSEPLTMTDKAIGTVNYISPEQASGGMVDRKSDIYSVGVMLYEMLTGVLPFTAESPVAVAMMQVSKEPTAPREINSAIPVGLEQIVLKAMSKKPEDRFQSAAAMEKALEYFVKNPTVVFADSSGEAAIGKKEKRKLTPEEIAEKRRLDKEQHRSMFPIILGIALSFFTVVSVFIIFVFASYMDQIDKDNGEKTSFGGFVDYLIGNEETEEITIENYIGSQYSIEFEKELIGNGFAVEVKKVSEKDRGNNEITDQYPNPNSKKKKPTNGNKITLTLYVNEISSNEKMPKGIIGTKQEAAISAITKALGLSEDRIIVEESNHEEHEKGYVFNVIPAEGTKIESTENLLVTLYVSTGKEPEEVEMIDVVGMYKEDAEDAIESQLESLSKPEIIYENSSEEDGRVIRTEPAAGTTFMDNEIVKLYISIYEAPVEDVPPVIDDPQDTEGGENSGGENSDSENGGGENVDGGTGEQPDLNDLMNMRG